MRVAETKLVPARPGSQVQRVALKRPGLSDLLAPRTPANCYCVVAESKPFSNLLRQMLRSRLLPGRSHRLRDADLDGRDCNRRRRVQGIHENAGVMANHCRVLTISKDEVC